MLGEDLSPGLAQERRGVFQVALELTRGLRLAGEEEDVCAARLAAADHQRQLELRYFFHQSSMVKRVLININATPDASVVSTNRNNAQGRLNTIKMFFPKVVGWGFPNHRGLTGLLAVASF